MSEIKPLNITAQTMHRAKGNPPSTLADTAISNCFPGLEFDFRNIWKNLFEGIELHESGLGESGHRVVGVESNSAAELAGILVFARLLSVNGISLEGPVTTPAQPTNRTSALEFSNALADVFAFAGQNVTCRFEQNGSIVTVDLPMRNIFESASIGEELAEPGAMTQSLCSPWHADYRECGCYYWAASRPDFVNVQPDGSGHDWMQDDRTAGAPYQPDQGGHFSPPHISYDDLYQDWESRLKFIIEGNDAE